MKIFFDVDDTIIHWIGDNPYLRVGVREAFSTLCDDNHVLFLWSGVGIRWDIVDRFDLRSWVEDCFHKPKDNPSRRLKEFGVPFRPDFVIDDYANIVTDFNGVVINRYQQGEAGEEFVRIVAAIRQKSGAITQCPGSAPMAPKA